MNAHALWRHLELHNRLTLWRARSAEAVFLAAVTGVLAAFLLWLIDPYWVGLCATAASWNPTLTVSAALLIPILSLTWQARQSFSEVMQSMHSDWLAATPITASERVRHAQRRAWRTHALRSLLAVLLWAWLAWRLPQIPPWWLAALLGLLLSSGPVIWVLHRSPSTAQRTDALRPAPVSRIPVAAHGLPILGAALEPMWIRLPRTAWAAGLGFLLLPMGSGPWLILGVALGFTAFGAATDLVAHWRSRYLADAAWLAAFPLAPRTLFQAYLPELGSRALRIAVILLLGAHACGAPPLVALLLALAGPLLIAHAVLAGYATRRDPQRYALWLPTHYAMLLASTQVFAPLLPAVCLLQCAWLWRRGSR